MSQDKYRRYLSVGENLFLEGEPGDTAFVIEAGNLEVWRDLNGKREILALLGPGEMLGEMSLIDHLPRSASATARVETRLRIITPQYLDERLGEANPLLRLLLKMVLKRYRAATETGEDPGGDEAEDRDSVLQRLALEQELEQALENNEFVLNYQPLVDLTTMRTAGFEALIRWVSPKRGFVSPGDFIPVVEDSHLVHGVGDWVMRTTCEAVRKFNDHARAVESPPVFIGFNTSGRQFSDPNLLKKLRVCLEETGIDPTLLKLEVTESFLMDDLESAIQMLDECRKLGVRIAVDDFGTGYSSLSYVHRLPADTLKVDRSFVTPLGSDHDSAKIVSAITGLAHSLDMNIVAEGIEEVEQAFVLEDLKVEYGQGYLFSKPVGEEKARALMGTAWPWEFDRRGYERRGVERVSPDRRSQSA